MFASSVYRRIKYLNFKMSSYGRETKFVHNEQYSKNNGFSNLRHFGYKIVNNISWQFPFLPFPLVSTTFCPEPEIRSTPVNEVPYYVSCMADTVPRDENTEDFKTFNPDFQDSKLFQSTGDKVW